jgi:hypothetical protein
MIERRKFVAALGIGTAILAAPSTARASNRHVDAAVRETKEAIHEGKQNMFSSFQEHTHNALDHARAAIAGGFNPKGHIEMAVKNLRDAIKVSKRSHSARRLEMGVRYAERALIHLKVAANES